MKKIHGVDADEVLLFIRDLNRSIDRGDTLKHIESEIGYSIINHAGYEACFKYSTNVSRFIVTFNLHVPYDTPDYADMTVEKAMKLYKLDTKGEENGKS